MHLLSDDVLDRSSVVANCTMNRQRKLAGADSYTSELGFNPLSLLQEKAASSGQVCWLDLCCGSGMAMIEAARFVHQQGLDAKIEIEGVDLVGQFSMPDPDLKCLRFEQASLAAWRPTRPFDVISCVHGLHYIGDKLGSIRSAVSWLTDNGRFAANLDLNSLKTQDGRSLCRTVASALRASGVQYDSRRKRVTCVGRKRVELPFRYIGADDQAGPNYTGQAAVDSYYA